MLQKMLDNKAKRELKTNQRRILIDSIEVGIPSPQHIYTWGARRLPNGEKVGQIKNSKTVSYKRLTPLRDGLFCERIFGPVNSFVCSCGKTQPRADVTFCEKCQVEYTDQRTRRYRLGYIPLLSPVAHLWYLKGRPSYLSLFLGQRKKKIVALAYCNAYLVEQGVYEKPYRNLALAPAGVTTFNQEREAHGINRYTQNINSFTSTRQISNLTNDLKANIFGIHNTATSNQVERANTTSQSMREEVISNTNPPFESVNSNANSNEFKTLTENRNPSYGNNTQTEKRAEAIEQNYNVKKSSHNLSLMQKNRSKWRDSAFYGFQEHINKAASPSSFDSLLTEALGHVEKNIILINSPKKDDAPKNHLLKRVDSSLKESWLKKKETKKTGNLFLLRPLWGYTHFEREAQGSTNLRSLLSAAERSESETFYQSLQAELDPKMEIEPKLDQRGTLLNHNAFAGVPFFADNWDTRASVLSAKKAHEKGFRQNTYKLIKTNKNLVSLLSYYLQYSRECHKSSGKVSFQKASIDLIPRVHIFAASSLPLRYCNDSCKDCSEYKALNCLTRHPLINPDQLCIDSSQAAKLQRKDLILSAQGERKQRAEKKEPKELKKKRFLTCYPNSNVVQFQDQGAVSLQTPRTDLSHNKIKKIRNIGKQTKGHGHMPYLVDRLRLVFKHARTARLADQVALFDGSTPSPIMGVTNDTSQLAISVPSVNKHVSTTSLFSAENPVGNSFYRLNGEMENDYESKQSAGTQSHFSLPGRETSLLEIAQTPQKGVKLYNRSHTFPFLPHLVCQYNLRDRLLNFLNSLPFAEDIPIPMYCKLPRRSPLRDVNQLMPEDSFYQFEQRPSDHSKLLQKPSLAFSKQKRGDFFKAAVNKNVRGARFRRAGSLSQLEVNAVAQKHFLNVKAQGIGQNAANLMAKDLSFDSKSQRGDARSTNSKSRVFHTFQTNSWQRDGTGSKLSINKTRAERNTEDTTLEQLASLRNILCIALLQKSVLLNVKRLDTRISKMSALLTKLSRENLIYNSIKISALNRFSSHLTIPNNYHNKNENVLAKFALNEKNLLRKIQHFDLPPQTGLKRLQEMPSLLRIINSFKLKSAEKSYRSFLLDKAWVRSSLLEKNLSDRKNDAITHLNSNLSRNVMTSPKGTVSQQGEFASGKQARLIPSIGHALRQHASGQTKITPYPFKTQKVWSYDFKGSLRKNKQLLKKRIQLLQHNLVLRNATLSNKRLKAGVLSHEKRLINRVYNLNLLLTHSEGSQKIPFLRESLSSSRSLVRDELFVREAVLLSCLPLELKPKGLQNFLQTCSQVQSASSLFETSLMPSLSRWVREIAQNASFVNDELVTHLDSAITQPDPACFSSSLSFFLIAPHSKRTKQKQYKVALLRLKQRKQPSLQKLSLEQKKTNNEKILSSKTNVQIQEINGNSQLIEAPNILFDTKYHHIRTGVELRSMNYQEAIQAIERSSKLAATSKSSKGLLEDVDRPSVKTAPFEIFERSSMRSSNSNRSSFARIAALRSDPHFRLFEPALSRRKLLYSRNSLNDGQKVIKGYVQEDWRIAGLADSTTFEEQTDQLSPFELVTIREILSYTGGGALHRLLERFDTQLFSTLLIEDVKNARKIYKKRIADKLHLATRIEKRVLTRLRRRIYKNSRRLKIAQLLTRCKRRPEWMMISVLPVLPPDLRPILKMSEGAVVVSDLNNLYQRVVYRNNRFHRLAFIDFHFVTPIQRLVQDAVDRLIENGKGGSKPLSTPTGRPLKSLSDTLKGKKGRFRLNLLGKRVDFSGRSVIVVSPNLQIHECGIPRQIALELYNYFLIRLFVLKKQVSNVVMGKKLIKQKNSFVWDALRTLIYHHPVLLNRAPTLHRLGIQAFQPKLVRGNAICLNPLVCSGFNADFDGDQMGVHLPLSTQARAEAWDLLWSRNNLLSPATGQAVLVPSQDMVLGLYYMTQSFASRSVLPFKNQMQSGREHVWENSSKDETRLIQHMDKDAHLFVPVPRTLDRAKRVFFDTSQLVQAFQNKQIFLHTPVWLKWKGKVENDEGFHAPIELRLNTFANSTYIYSSHKRRKDESTSQSHLYIRTTAGRVLINLIVFA